MEKINNIWCMKLGLQRYLKIGLSVVSRREDPSNLNHLIYHLFQLFLIFKISRFYHFVIKKVWFLKLCQKVKISSEYACCCPRKMMCQDKSDGIAKNSYKGCSIPRGYWKFCRSPCYWKFCYSMTFDSIFTTLCKPL